MTAVREHVIRDDRDASPLAPRCAEEWEAVVAAHRNGDWPPSEWTVRAREASDAPVGRELRLMAGGASL